MEWRLSRNQSVFQGARAQALTIILGHHIYTITVWSRTMKFSAVITRLAKRHVFGRTYSINFRGRSPTPPKYFGTTPNISPRNTPTVDNILSPVKIGPKMAAFRELRGANVKFLFSNSEKAHPGAEPRRLRITRENRFGGLGCGALEEPPKKKERKEAE